MSILNTANDGLYNILVILTLALIRFGPQSKHDLMHACGANITKIGSPGANQKVKSSMIRNTIDSWVQLGLFDNNDDLVTIKGEYLKQLGKNTETAEQKLRKIVRDIVFSERNNERFWESENNKSADLTRGLSWVLAQNVYEIDTSSHSKIQELEIKQVPPSLKRIFENDTRWNGFRIYALALGFARKTSGTQICIDPTTAIRESLPDIFKTNKRLLADKFIENTANILPVLDKGKYRLKIEEKLRSESWDSPPPKFVSTSLSRALRRLQIEGILAYDRLADVSTGIILPTYDYSDKNNITITHIELKTGLEISK